jgi:large subunit ribosomal protein L21
MYAVVEAGGRQFELTAGRFIDVDMVAAEPEQEFVFDKVLAIINGADSVLGQPYVSGAKVTGKVINHVRSSKIVVFKYRAKKGTRKRTGHRQYHTRVFINKIELNDKVLSEAQDNYKKED